MVVYIALFLISAVLGIILTGKNPTKTKKIVYLSITFGLMFVVSAFRYGMGNDYFSYMRIFSEIIVSDFGTVFTMGYEPLFVLLTKLIAVFTTNPEIMYGIYSALILIPVAIAIYRHSDKVWISVSVYLCLTFFYTTLNFIRQSLAVSVLILAYGFMKEKKVVPVLIMAVVAVLFHYTAAAFIPFYLLSLLKPTKKNLIIYSSVSVGLLVTCLIMKVCGVNPLDLAAEIVTAITGKDYASYIGSKWFESGFGVQYLIMPLAVLALVMISYFLGWKEKKGADMLLWFSLMNASVWLFITFAFIVERFSMFIFIFSVFTIPSVLSYYEEKAELAEKNVKKPDKTMPGYSKKMSEEKKDNSFLLTTVTVFGMFVYNCWSLYMNFHGVMPYMVLSPAVQDVIDGFDSSEENLTEMLTNADLYTYLIELKNADCGYMVLSTTEDYTCFNNAIRRAADYTGTRINEGAKESAEKLTCFTEYNDRNGDEYFACGRNRYTAKNGIFVSTSDRVAYARDTKGQQFNLRNGRMAILLFNEKGEIFDATEFDLSIISRKAAKLYAVDSES